MVFVRLVYVDPASSHMLVSKIKPCMSQHQHSHGETANGSLKQLYIVYLIIAATWITVVILEPIHASKPDFAEGLCLLDAEPTGKQIISMMCKDTACQLHSATNDSIFFD